MPEKFDFTKIEDLKKFEDLPKKEQDKVSDEAQEEALGMNYDNYDMGLFLDCLSKGYIDLAIDYKERFNLPDEIVQEFAKKEFINFLTDETPGLAFEIYQKFSLPSEFAHEEAKKEFIQYLSKGDLGFAIKTIKEKFSLDDNFISSPEVQEIIKQRVVYSLSLGWITDIVLLKEKLFLSDKTLLSPEIQKAALDSFKNLLLESKKGSFFNAHKILEYIPLPENEAIQCVKESVIALLSEGADEVAYQVFEEFKLSEDLLTSPELKEAARKAFFILLSIPHIHTALSIREKHCLSISSQEIIGQMPDLQNLLDQTQKISPEFYNQALRSEEIVIELVKFKNEPEKFIKEIHEAPFLLEAVMHNHRFGSKLLIKYSQFDKLSKENISTLFDIKKQILSNSPEINPESLEFRQAMQEKLKEYKNNPAILEQLEKDGINIDEWLNYAETKYFNLESGDSHLAFSETVSAPITRIKETLDRYAHTLKEVLKEYRPELTEFKIPAEDLVEMKNKISVMQAELEKAKAEGDEKKNTGIEKGIENLQNKIEKVKTVNLWDKFLGDISAFQRLKDDVYGAQEKLIKTESELQEKLSGKMPSGRMIHELKQKISNAKEELRNKFGVLEKRIENFKNNLPELITPALGKERAGALIQEIEQNLAEQFDHYNTDRSTVANLFSERGDKEKSKMENQPMSIFVWARNPDVDLYQGNYSDCCIRIDSEHMGAESTIADYNTDLGMQIVNIWNETKNEPVTAAWCWIGKNEKGETVLVVDNIESNTQYSANYSEQLSKELFAYLENYAKSIGVKKIVLGKANNDLPTSGELAKMKDDEDKYEKAGGYNRPDGYFLEAEDKTVKILWENLEPIEKVMQKVEKVAKVEFKDLNIKNLSEKDFEKIKKLEKKIYKDTGLALGQAMIEYMRSRNGLEYSIIVSGKRSEGKKKEAIGYLVALEDKTDEGDPCVYLEDIALLPEAQGQQIGWDMMKSLIAKLKEKARKENKPILLDMHLRETSQRFFERYQNELDRMGVNLIEEALVPDYYDEGEDALYKVYQIQAE